MLLRTEVSCSFPLIGEAGAVSKICTNSLKGVKRSGGPHNNAYSTDTTETTPPSTGPPLRTHEKICPVTACEPMESSKKREANPRANRKSVNPVSA